MDDGDLDYLVTLSSRVTGSDIMITLMSVSRPQEHEGGIPQGALASVCSYSRPRAMFWRIAAIACVSLDVMQ